MVLGLLAPGASFKKLKIRLLPRFGASKKILRFPRAMSKGFKIQKSLQYSTLPLLFRGALSKLTISLFRRLPGATSPYKRPTIFSYAPVMGNSNPAAKLSRVLMMRRVIMGVHRTANFTYLL